MKMSWQKLKDLIQSIKPADFEKLVARLLELHLKDPFFVARSGDQPSGDARDQGRKISMQAKRYTTTQLNESAIVGEIYRTREALPDLQVYVLVVSRNIVSQQRDRFDAVEEDTGIDIVILDLTDKLSDLGALCVTFWDDIRRFFSSSELCQNQKFLTWVREKKDDSKTEEKVEDIRLKLEDGIQTQSRVQKDAEKYLLERFSRSEGFNPINLSKGIERPALESEILAWWENQAQPVCCLEGEEGNGKTWLAAKSLNSISEKENIVTFWLDSRDWRGHKSIYDLLRSCFSLIYASYEQRKITKLQNKAARIWREILIVLDGVNERGAIKAAQRILDEYLKPESEWRGRIRFLLTTRPLDDYPDFEKYLWNGCHEISVVPFNDLELQDALTRNELQPDDLPNSLKDIAKIPRYFQTCIRLRHRFGSFSTVTTELVLWTDLLEKIERTDPQIKQKLGWHRIKDAQEILSDLAKQAKWTNVDTAPQASVQLLEKYFSDYREIRHDLEEQRIALEAGPLQARLNADHVVLGWALYLSNLFERTEFTGIKDFAEGFQNALEPIPSEDLRTEALFIALQISAISPDPGISQDQLSQKRAALMLAWSNSHNANITDDRLFYWTEEDSDAYAQVVEVEFENHNVPKYEEMLIEPLARTWLNKKGHIDRLESRLKKWLLPTYSVNSPENREYTDVNGAQVPLQRYDPQVQLSAAALSILSQRPEREFLETLARCYETLERYENLDRKDIGVLMRWGYTEDVLDNLHSLAKQTQDDKLLSGIRGLASSLHLVELPLLLQYPVSEKDKERHAFVEQWNRTFKPYIDRIRDQEKLLVGDSPADNVQGNYHGLDYLSVRADLSDLRNEDLVEIRKLLHYISENAELGQNLAASLEGFCIANLLPWVARYDPESYAELACSLKLNALNQKWAQIILSSIQGLIFKPEDCRKITETILGMKQRLVQEIQRDSSSSDVIYLTSLLTETLLFSAPEEKLTDWFEFLSLDELLRRTICYKPLPSLLEQLLPESIVKLAQRKLETLGPITSDNHSLYNEKPERLLEREYWNILYGYGIQTNDNIVTWALENLKQRESNLHPITFYSLYKATSDSNRFLSEILVNEEIREHLFLKENKFFTTPIYEGENSYSYEDLVSVLPQEIVGSFLCSPKRRADLSRWGKEFMERKCSILQGAEGDSNFVKELRFRVKQRVLQIWAKQNEAAFLQLADKYFTEFFKSPRYRQGLSYFTNVILCLLLRFQPSKAMRYYRRWNAEGSRAVCLTNYDIETFLAQLWQVEDCNLPEHCQFRRELLEECLNDEEIMFMTLAALVGGGEEELWNLVTQEYLESPYAKERNLGISILPWFGEDKAIEELEQLKSEDSNRWVREHAAWAYEVAQQERSCREVYREALQTRDLFRISAVFEQMKPALSPIARWWHREIEEKEFSEELQDSNPKLFALLHRFWYRWGKSTKTKRNIKVFNRKFREYCRGEKFLAGRTPRIAPWWKPDSNRES